VLAGSLLVPLETRLNDYALATSPRGCLVTIRNTCTPDREALIVAAGVHFWFYDIPAVGHPTDGDYMAGPVHVEVPPGVTVPFRFSDWRRPVYKVAVGVRVMFGNPNGYPPASYENFFWEMVLPPLPYILPRPLYANVGEIHLDFRLKRQEPIPRSHIPVPPPPPVPVVPVVGGAGVIPNPGNQFGQLGVFWPPIPGPFRGGQTNWFELAERPR
jgi:hypothetical protein